MELIRFPVYAPATIAGVSITIWPVHSALADELFVNMEEYDEITFAITITNANSLVACKLQWSPDAETAHAEDIYDFGAIAAGTTESHTVNNNKYTYMRVIATGNVNPNEVDAEVYVTAKRKVM
jgi:hypothetical protein